MNSAELSEYKLNIIRQFIKDEELVKLIDPHNEFEYPDEMIYERLFPFARIPDTEEEVKTYITITIDVPSIGDKNDIVRNVTISIRAITHSDLMKVPSQNGTRIDLISAKVDEILNESYDFGIGKVTLFSNTEHTLDFKHFYRELRFKTMDLNSRRYGA